MLAFDELLLLLLLRVGGGGEVYAFRVLRVFHGNRHGTVMLMMVITVHVVVVVDCCSRYDVSWFPWTIPTEGGI